MSESKQIVDLNAFANGEVAARFNYELQQLLENIADPNTDHKKARKLTMTLTLKPNEAREIVDTSIQVKSSPAPRKDVGSVILIDRDETGKTVGAELKSGTKGQTYLDDDGTVKDDKGEVIDFRKQGGTK
ncbi:replication terminator protein [Gracilibacillus saliphilus]|uniref:replication terminator protein n=1 Tax=Gracilibacillus saliphilus TaxID=543890 RepID=UPI0013D02D9D|nr:replication terminator protein [Gracilibacillus saliphilus]